MLLSFYFISHQLLGVKFPYHVIFLFLLLVSDLLHFAPKLALDADHASSLFDRLDSDNDGFLDEHDWERVTNTLTCTSKHTFYICLIHWPPQVHLLSSAFLKSAFYHKFRFEMESSKEQQVLLLSSVCHYKFYFYHWLYSYSFSVAHQTSR